MKGPWLPSKPDDVWHLVKPDQLARGLEFADFWVRMMLDEHRRGSEEWARFCEVAAGKAINGAQEHKLEGFMYPRPASYWVREMKDEIYDLASYGSFALWAAADHPDPRPRLRSIKGLWEPPLPADPDKETME